MKLILTKDEALNAIYEVYKHLNKDGPIDIDIELEEVVPQEIPAHYNLNKLVKEWIEKGYNQIECIKDIKTLTGWTLTDSKKFLDNVLAPF